MSSVSLVTLNVQVSEHLERASAFLKKQQADVVCLQELAEGDVNLYKEAIGAIEHFYAPMVRETRRGVASVVGIGIFSRLPMRNTQALCYDGDMARLPETDSSKPETFGKKNQVLIVADIDRDGTPFKICNTHFTWTFDGQADDRQRRDMQAMLAAVLPMGELVFCGDFNAPRGWEMFTELTKHFKDNVPPQYITSLDRKLHRAGHLGPARKQLCQSVCAVRGEIV